MCDLAVFLTSSFGVAPLGPWISAVHLGGPLGNAVRRSLAAAGGAGRGTGRAAGAGGGGGHGLVSGVGPVDLGGGVDEQLPGRRAELAHVFPDALELSRVGPVLGGELVELGEEQPLLTGAEGGVVGRVDGLGDGGKGHDRRLVHDGDGRGARGRLSEEAGDVEHLGVGGLAPGGVLRHLEVGGEEAKGQRHEGDGRRGGEVPPQHFGHERHFRLLDLPGVELAVAEVDELAEGDADALLGEGGVDASVELWLGLFLCDTQ